MKKIFLVLIIACFSLPTALAQSSVGINTAFPKGAFHVDAAGDNTSTSPNPNEILNDVIAKTDTHGATVGVGGESTKTSAQLQLLDPNKAFLLNRVALQSATDVSTVPNPKTGTMVFNTQKSGTLGDVVNPGVHYFSGRRWYPFMSGSWKSDMNSKDLVADVTSGTSGSVTATNFTGSNTADFGEITISDEGYYSFSLRLYGPLSTSSNWLRASFYVYLVRSDNSIADVIEIIMPSLSNAGNTYTGLLRGYFNKGESVTIRFAHTGSISWKWLKNPGANANKTSLLYWKG